MTLLGRTAILLSMELSLASWKTALGNIPISCCRGQVNKVLKSKTRKQLHEGIRQAAEHGTLAAKLQEQSRAPERPHPCSPREHLPILAEEMEMPVETCWPDTKL